MRWAARRIWIRSLARGLSGERLLSIKSGRRTKHPNWLDSSWATSAVNDRSGSPTRSRAGTGSKGVCESIGKRDRPFCCSDVTAHIPHPALSREEREILYFPSSLGPWVVTFECARRIQYFESGFSEAGFVEVAGVKGAGRAVDSVDCVVHFPAMDRHPRRGADANVTWPRWIANTFTSTLFPIKRLSSSFRVSRSIGSRTLFAQGQGQVQHQLPSLAGADVEDDGAQSV
jgi:hypothetical protein